MSSKMIVCLASLTLMLTVACPAQAELLLEYKFNETGTTAPSTVPDTTALTMYTKNVF